MCDNAIDRLDCSDRRYLALIKKSYIISIETVKVARCWELATLTVSIEISTCSALGGCPFSSVVERQTLGRAPVVMVDFGGGRRSRVFLPAQSSR